MVMVSIVPSRVTDFVADDDLALVDRNA